MRRLRAFTLIELLVVIAIIAILAAILFPVFAQAKAAAKKAAAISNHKQLSLAVIQYMSDYDDTYPLASVTVTYAVYPIGTNPPDATWGYLSYPYMKNDQIFADPMDPAGVTERDTDGSPHPSGTVPAQYRTEQLRYNLSLKADYGVNTQFFSPWGYMCPLYFTPFAISQTQVAQVADTIYGISSVWDRDSRGNPHGGGNWALDAPCIYSTTFVDKRPFVSGCPGYWWFGGWNPGSPLAWNVYGGVWPWHTSSTLAIVSYADGHVNAKRIPALTQGCDVRNGFQGTIIDPSRYIWDLE